MQKGVVFDLFGTLIPKWDSRRSIDVTRQIARHLDLPATPFAEAWADTFFDRELGRASVVASLRRAALAVYRESTRGGDLRVEEAYGIWRKLVASKIRPRNADVLATLRNVRERGFRIGLISNCGPDVPDLFRDSVLAALVDHATFSCEVGMVKPDPAIYRLHCRELGVRPEQSLYVGDGGSDELNGAAHCGLTAFLLHVDEEVAREGLPEEAKRWRGPALRRLEDIRSHLNGP